MDEDSQEVHFPEEWMEKLLILGSNCHFKVSFKPSPVEGGFLASVLRLSELVLAEDDQALSPHDLSTNLRSSMYQKILLEGKIMNNLDFFIKSRPRGLIAKFSSPNPVMLEQACHCREFGFYSKISQLHQLSKDRLTIPICYFATLSGELDLSDGTAPLPPFFLLEDLTLTGFHGGSFVHGLNIEEIYASIRAIAAFHAPFFAQTSSASRDMFAQVHKDIQFNQPKSDSEFAFNYAISSFPTLCDVMGRLGVEPTALRQCEALLGCQADFDKMIASHCSVTLCHGDLWANNILFKRIDTDSDSKASSSTSFAVALVDFQWVYMNCGLTDLAFFLFSSVPTKLCSTHLDDFVSVYHSAISSHPNVEFSLEKCRSEFYLGVVWALAVATCSIDVFVRAGADALDRVRFLVEFIGTNSSIIRNALGRSERGQAAIAGSKK